MMYKNWKIWFLVNGCMIFHVMLVTGCCKDSYSLIELQGQQGYVFDIRADCFAEISRPVFCRITKDQSILLEKGLGVTRRASKLQFALLEKGDIFAIVETANPRVLVALFDRDIQQYWTCMAGPEYNAVGKELLQRLNRNQDGMPFVLCHTHELKHEPAK